MFLCEQIGADHPVVTRTLAADVLSRARYDDAQLTALAAVFARVGPLEAEKLLSAFGKTQNADVGRALVDALGRSPALASIRPETIATKFARFPEDVRAEAGRLSQRLEQSAATQRQRLESLLSSVSGGDIKRGQAVFNSPKAACVSCHAIGYLGGKVGPDLTRIGQVRTERDLLEAILYPSASFVRSYEPVVVATQDGRVFSGLTTRDAADELILATGPNQEARIPRDQIEEIRPGTVSVMPAGLDQQMTPRELADLLAFLKACR